MAKPRDGYKPIQFSLPSDLDKLIEQAVVDGKARTKSDLAIKAFQAYFAGQLVIQQGEQIAS